MCLATLCDRIEERLRRRRGSGERPLASAARPPLPHRRRVSTCADGPTGRCSRGSCWVQATIRRSSFRGTTAALHVACCMLHAAITAMQANHPRCVRCGGKARPSILMFEDCGWVGNSRARKRFQAWSKGIFQLGDRAAKTGRPLRLAILEIGAGANVTTVRRTSEGLVQDALKHGITPMLVRVNPEYPLADEDSCRKYTVPLLSTGLAAVKMIDAAVGEAGLSLSDQAAEAWRPNHHDERPSTSSSDSGSDF